MEKHSITAASVNLRVDNEWDGENAFANRRGWVAQQLRALGADIYGFQEAKLHMRAFLEDALPEYAFLGCGRDVDCGGEHTPVAYKKDAFSLLELRNFWLSLTPDVPGSRYGADQSSCPRICTVARLLHKASGRSLLFYNTHLDHVGAVAQLLGAAQIRQALSRDLPAAHAPMTAIITGDFNVTPESDCIRLMTQDLLTGDVVLQDATAGLSGTYHGFGSVEPSKIDYIFTNAPFAGSRVLGGKSPEGLWFSDHEMVASEIELL
ncbi:MAG: endonuclease/exonuclease/phosphatase family protein [Oscillospiraceae bacterium]|jgi:endonuclease/exonuclease/phosphatase family metal-dependent hydrolase|nr:endonuclease/exonuclease/phosphatase family protein [Oscillospiraceae bacterium]